MIDNVLPGSGGGSGEGAIMRYRHPENGDSVIWAPEFYLPFDSGTGAEDETLQENDGTLDGPTPPVLDSINTKFGDRGIEFPVNLTNQSRVNMGVLERVTLFNELPWHFNAWIKIGPAGPEVWLLARWNAAFSWEANGRGLILTPTGQLQWALHGTPNVTLATGLNNGQWRHILVQHDPDHPYHGTNMLDTWVDGTHQGATTVSFGSLNQAHGIFVGIGGNVGTVSLFMDDVAYGNYLLSKETIAALQTQTYGTADLVAS